MSHIVTVATMIKDERAVQRALQIMKLEPAKHGVFTVFSNKVEGLGFKLPGWNYPVVADLSTGKVQYDNYKGTWGKQEEFDKFQQRYALEAAKSAADDAGQTYSAEYTDAQGRICFDINENNAHQHVLVGGESGNDGPKFAL